MKTTTSLFPRIGFALAIALLATPASARPVFVTNGADSGAGSFRAAVGEASADPSISSILFARKLGTIKLESTIFYNGAQALLIDGQGTRVAGGDGMFDLFVSEGGADLVLDHLDFKDGLNGIVVTVPAEAVGEIRTTLLNVTVEDNGEYGLLIDDLDEETDGGSAAGIGLDILFSKFIGNGRNILPPDIIDFDGVRVNERGDGSITASVLDSTFSGNGADGYELDEGGGGDVRLIVQGSTFDGNGVLEPDGDDGLDVDESDDGSIWLSVVDSTFNRGTDDGIGIDESGPGDLHLTAVRVETSHTGDKGFSIDEGDEGDLIARVFLVRADRNVENGLNFSEAGPGDFELSVVQSVIRNNDLAGIDVAQELEGEGVLRLHDVKFRNNDEGPIATENVEVIEIP